MTINTMPENLEIEDEIAPVGGKGRAIVISIGLYEQELSYVDRLGAIYGLNRSAVIRQIINNDRMAKFAQEQS